jgi:hypothetical protein
LTLQTACLFLHTLGFAVYGGAVVLFAILLAIPARQSRVGKHQLLEALQAWGPFQGLAMGALIAGGIGLHLSSFGLHWPPEGAAPGLLAKYGFFFLLWVSSFHLEIWTLEPIRRNAPDPASHVARISRQVQANALLFGTVLFLAFWA